MKTKPRAAIRQVYRKRGAIRTSLMDLLKEITALTQDDAVALAVFKRIFNSHRVRLARTLAPVEIVAAPRCARFAGRKAWA